MSRQDGIAGRSIASGVGSRERSDDLLVTRAG